MRILGHRAVTGAGWRSAGPGVVDGGGVFEVAWAVEGLSADDVIEDLERGLSSGMRNSADPRAGAREELRAVHERQQAALGAYFAAENKAARLHAQLAAVEHTQRLALGQLAELAGAELAARLTSTSTARAREALSLSRQQASPETAAPGGGTAS